MHLQWNVSPCQGKLWSEGLMIKEEPWLVVCVIFITFSFFAWRWSWLSRMGWMIFKLLFFRVGTPVFYFVLSWFKSNLWPVKKKLTWYSWNHHISCIWFLLEFCKYLVVLRHLCVPCYCVGWSTSILSKHGDFMTLWVTFCCSGSPLACSTKSKCCSCKSDDSKLLAKGTSEIEGSGTGWVGE